MDPTGLCFDKVMSFCGKVAYETSGALEKAYKTFAFNESLHKELEFGMRGTWELTKENFKIVGQDVFWAWVKIPFLKDWKALVMADRAITYQRGAVSFMGAEQLVEDINSRMEKIRNEIYGK
jgi:hypothetical protein